MSVVVARIDYSPKIVALLIFHVNSLIGEQTEGHERGLVLKNQPL